MSYSRYSAEQKARADGYVFSGVYHRRYDREKTKARAAELRAEGYKARIVSVDGGQSVYIKDTEKTLAAKAEQARVEEEERAAMIEETHSWLTELDLSKMTSNRLRDLRHVVKNLVERGF